MSDHFHFDVLISAELVLEEKIEYNDLVNSVEDRSPSAVDKDGSSIVGGTSNTESKTGEVCLHVLLILTAFVLLYLGYKVRLL